MGKTIFPLLAVLLLITGCSKPSLIEEDKFVVVYTELIIAQDTSEVPGNDFIALKQQVFEKHDITEKEYNETLDYYNEDPQRWEQFFNKAIERLERLKKLEEKEL